MRKLNRINEDYEAHRKGDWPWRRPSVRVVRRGGFEEWMKLAANPAAPTRFRAWTIPVQMTQDMTNWFADQRLAGVTDGVPCSHFWFSADDCTLPT